MKHRFLANKQFERLISGHICIGFFFFLVGSNSENQLRFRFALLRNLHLIKAVVFWVE